MSKLQDLSETQSKFLLERIQKTEDNIHGIEACIQGITRKEAKYCNKIDELAAKFKSISETEVYDDSLAKIYDIMSTSIVHLGDIEAIKQKRFQDKVCNDLIKCEIACQNTKVETKNLLTLRDFEMNKRSKIDLHKKSRKNILSENEVMLSNIQISKVLKELTMTAEKFENQKLATIKEFLLNFILIQLKYFSSGIEIFTSAFQDISSIDDSCRAEKFTTEVKNINKQFKRHIEQDGLQGYRFPFMRALSKFSASSSNLADESNDFSNKKRIDETSKSLMSLNSLGHVNDSDDNMKARNISTDFCKDEDISDSDESDESSNMEPTDTENIQKKQ